MIETTRDIVCWLSKLEPAAWIAIIALVTSCFFAFQNWRHNKLSVTPNLDVRREIFPESAYIAIRSSGIGPAIVRKIDARIEGKSFDLTDVNGMIEFNEQYEYVMSRDTIVEKEVPLGNVCEKNE